MWGKVHLTGVPKNFPHILMLLSKYEVMENKAGNQLQRKHSGCLNDVIWRHLTSYDVIWRHLTRQLTSDDVRCRHMTSDDVIWRLSKFFKIFFYFFFWIFFLCLFLQLKLFKLKKKEKKKIFSYFFESIFFERI